MDELNQISRMFVNLADARQLEARRASHREHDEPHGARHDRKRAQPPGHGPHQLPAVQADRPRRASPHPKQLCPPTPQCACHGHASMKASSISGDARRVLDICRRTIELVHSLQKLARTDDVKEVIKERQNSPTAAYLRELSLNERLMLAALIRCVRQEGIEEIK
ncbi:hypothetical protein L226DRAFT_278178 [Lentinus tigrinus ALCF2SS1-7]|uniref:uncharacterized protein n=1 Tax=Lentinus tigrinus ALCF2SS1-7 TaxID=1328758 RepID=UPI001165EF5C|nr:hypothetical protein L226DRAFT_278178 [Lentinus tigrinus ALCF2SS1-7]